MKKYKAIFSSFHTLYRLTTSLSETKNFIIGVSRLYKNTLKAEKVTVVYKLSNTHGYIKVQLQDKKQTLKRGNISVLTKQEKDILKQNREIILDNRLIYPFVFSDISGVVYVTKSTRSDIFDDLEKKWFIAISEQVSVYLKIFSLYQEQRRILIGYIKSITRLLDQYIPTSYLHTKSVFKLIRAMGKEMKLPESEIKSLEYASMLHDAGKLQIPSKLLEKQRPLTNKEYKLVRKHPRKGVELIKDLASLKPVIPIILHHHEKYDGSGYPSRLKKEEIPLGSRILAVIDAFDAMFFGRPYKKRMRLGKVKKELKKQRSIQFDPKIVESFLKVLKKKSIKKHLNYYL